MALYPQTTCFYKAVIHEPPSRVSIFPELKQSHLTYKVHSSGMMTGLSHVKDTAYCNFGLAEQKEILWKEVRKNHLWTEGIQSSPGLTDICTPTWINLGPLDMSAANRVGSVSEISPRRRFFRKNSHVFIWEAGLPRLPTSRFSRRRSRQPEKHFPIWTLPRGWPGRNLFWENSITFAS